VHLDRDLCFQASRSRDPRFDGRFFIAVRTTGIYCRPICPARPPRRENVTFYEHAAAAEEAGFRPCRRCRPDAAPSTPAWSGTAAVVSRALRLIDDGALDQGDVDDLARRVGLGSRHLRRLFLTHVGAAPIVVAQTRRLHVARTLVETTTLPITQIALGSGFASLRRFNASFLETYGLSPTALRSNRRPVLSARIELRLAYRPPFDWAGLLEFLRARAIDGVEIVDEDSYARTITIGDARGALRVRHATRGYYLTATVPASFATSIRAVAEQVRRLFDLGADPLTVADHLGRDPVLRSVIAERPGIRVPGCWSPFELAVRAIVGQQVSVTGARTVLGRIAATHGDAIDTGVEGLTRLFPGPEKLARASIAGMPRKRAEAIGRLASAVLSSGAILSSGASLEQSIESLTALPGVGPWTAQYIAMRALGEPDAFPYGDLGLRKAAGENGMLSAAELSKRSEAWRPWRAYAAMMLWQRLSM
jgi:AraC family transcriptional regulator of adaptative response / DNA-3-methyladenine glycosylase II